MSQTYIGSTLRTGSDTLADTDGTISTTQGIYRLAVVYAQKI